MKRTPGRARSCTPRMREPGRAMRPCSRVTKWISWCLRGSSQRPSAAAAAAARGRASATWKPARSHSPRASAGEAFVGAANDDLELERGAHSARELLSARSWLACIVRRGRGSGSASASSGGISARSRSNCPPERRAHVLVRFEHAAPERGERAPRPRCMSTSGAPKRSAASPSRPHALRYDRPRCAPLRAAKPSAPAPRAAAAARGRARAATLRRQPRGVEGDLEHGYANPCLFKRHGEERRQ